jgi:arylformamidase
LTLYRDFTSSAEIDREYNPRLTVGDGEATARLNEVIERSLRIRSEYTSRQDVPYGDSDAETVDIYLAAKRPAPIHVFIHGGYWRAFSSKDFASVAEACVENDITAVLVNYALCPAVTIDEIVRQCRAALSWVWKNAPSFDGDPKRLSLSGHSAGGHLTAMLLATDWTQWGLPADAIRFACPISGLYDLGPFPHSFLQPSLKLDAAQVTRNSPLFLSPRTRSPVLVAVGGDETAEFHRQAEEYVAWLKRHGIAVDYLDLAGRNHFTVLDDFRGRGGPLFQAMLPHLR